MIKLTGKRYRCSLCGWEHTEVDTVASLGNFLNGFSNPDVLREIMIEQSVKNVALALMKHSETCPAKMETTNAQI
jgi:hypothetical protein